MAVELASLNQSVVQARQEVAQAETRLRDAERRLMSQSATVMSRENGVQLLSDLTAQWNEKIEQLSSAKEAFEIQRSRVENQSAKLDSFEKLVQGKSETVAYQQQRTDQQIADEQYLQSSFPRSDS